MTEQYLFSKFKYRISIEHTVGMSSDLLGGVIKKWERCFDTWADLQEVKVASTDVRGITEAKTITKFTIRYNKNLNKNMRIKYKNKLYSINEILIKGDSAFQKVLCEEKSY